MIKKISLATTVVALVATAVGTAMAGEASADPVAAGPHRVATATYSLGDTAFRLDGYTAEVQGVVHHPADLGGRAHPMVVMLHGLFETCADPVAAPAFADARLKLFGPDRVQDPAERERLSAVMADAGPKLSVWPCPAGVEPVRSFRGYDYLGRFLAGHGFVVVSIGANGINAGGGTGDEYTARQALINRHLELWQQLSASGGGALAGKVLDATGAAVDFRGRVDLTNVGTLGHSRGGRAVMLHAADENQDEWPAGVKVKAVVPMEPVPFGGGEVVTNIPVAAIVGACDSVSNPGARDYVERGPARVPRHIWTVQGANHDFFNSQWSPQENPVLGVDDAHVDAFATPAPAGRCATPDGVEQPQLSEDAQRTLGIGYVGAFFRKFLAGETGFDAMLAGKRAAAGSGGLGGRRAAAARPGGDLTGSPVASRGPGGDPQGGGAPGYASCIRACRQRRRASSGSGAVGHGL